MQCVWKHGPYYVVMHCFGRRPPEVDPCEAKVIIQKYSTLGGNTPTHVALMSDVSHDDPHGTAPLDMPTLGGCTDAYDDTKVSEPFKYIALLSSLAPGRDLSRFWVVDSAYSISLTAFRSDFATLHPPAHSSRVGAVGVDVQGSGTLQTVIPIVAGQLIRSTSHALYSPAMSSRSAKHIGRLLSVRWMQTHNGCEFLFPTDYDIGLLMVPT
jgi:hypothetical protein